MESQILTKIRKLNWVLSESATGFFSFSQLCKILSELMNANSYILSKRGKILASEFVGDDGAFVTSDPHTGADIISKEYNRALLGLNATMTNIVGQEVKEIFGPDYGTPEKIHIIIPIIFGEKRIGTVILARANEEFTDEDIALCEYGATVVGVEISRGNALEEEEEIRMYNSVTMALETLSYSELDAVTKIFAELEGNEGLLIASKIADRSGITRSVIVNALRKLESAGVIESRSLGMKGTRIKITNEFLKEEIAKIEV